MRSPGRVAHALGKAVRAHATYGEMKAGLMTHSAPDQLPTDRAKRPASRAQVVREDLDFAKALRRWGRRHPYAGYGGMFRAWPSQDDAGP
jgi:hypothetical protein